MEIIVQKFQSSDEIKREEYRSWECVAPDAGHQMSVERYRADDCFFEGLHLEELLFAVTRNTLDMSSSADIESSYTGSHA